MSVREDQNMDELTTLETIHRPDVLPPAGPGGQAFSPRSLPEAIEFAKLIATSDLVPKDYHGKPANVVVAIQWGYEIGLHPMQALQNIAVINGRPSVWGDAAKALVESSRLCEYIEETLEGAGDALKAVCVTKRRGRPNAHRVEFSVADAKQAGLWGQNTWAKYPKRMLQMRARGFCLRDVYPDVLKGLITTEEAMDTPAPDAPPQAIPAVVPDAQPAAFPEIATDPAPPSAAAPRVKPNGSAPKSEVAGCTCAGKTHWPNNPKCEANQASVIQPGPEPTACDNCGTALPAAYIRQCAATGRQPLCEACEKLAASALPLDPGGAGGEG